MDEHAPMSKVFALPLRIGRGTRNEAPIFDHHGELRAECVDDDCEERALAVVRAVNNHEELVKALTAATHALRSYQYGNSATDLAESTADFGETVLKSVGTA